eukprot:Hpha_TRINITY_DN270_c0_g1::TRINITY_DN270_c0_g1_i1::g.83714::m.83714
MVTDTERDRSQLVSRAVAAAEEHGTPNTTQRGRKGAVLVRTHRPTAAALKRIAQWTAEVQSGGWDLWVQADASSSWRQRPEVEAMWERLRSACGGRLHLFTDEEMRERFPALSEPKWTAGKRTLGYGFHCQAISLWWRCSGVEYEWVWVLEDDVGCSGRLGDVLNAHADDDADLLTYNWKQRHPGWPWKEAVSRGFRTVCPKLSDQLFSREHVQRLSGRLLAALERFSLDGVVAWSEMATPSLCRCLCLKEGSLRTEHIGDKYAWNARLSELDFEERCSADSRPMLYHALKW